MLFQIYLTAPLIDLALVRFGYTFGGPASGRSVFRCRGFQKRLGSSGPPIKDWRMFIHAYLWASTAEQDAAHARAALDAFAASHRFRIATRYLERESGTRLARPELFRLLDDCGLGDVSLVEQVDRLSRLS